MKKELQREGSAPFRFVLTTTEEQDIIQALKISAQLEWGDGWAFIKKCWPAW